MKILGNKKGKEAKEKALKMLLERLTKGGGSWDWMMEPGRGYEGRKWSELMKTREKTEGYRTAER